jgi:hypothetical protein
MSAEAIRTWALVGLVFSGCSGGGGDASEGGGGTQPAPGPATATPPAVTSVPSAGAPAAPPPVTTTPMAGAGAAPPFTQPTTPPPTDPVMPPVQMPPDEPGLAMDECGLDTQWNGDEYCILPPPPDKGFQIHIGPSDYANPEPQYVMEPGQEVTESWDDVSGNGESVYYYWRQYRMRPGSHHLIVSSAGLGGRRLGGTQNSAKDNPDRGVIAKENQGVGMQLAANTPISMSLHYMNYTDKPIIKEVWVNFWYRDPEDVTEAAKEMFSMAPMGIQPGQHVLLHGTCPVSGTGRVLTLYGHVHANNHRFSAWRTRGGQKQLVYEMYDWEHPLVLEYSSIVENSAADPTGKIGGGWNGILDLQPGDALEFECDITNDTSQVFLGRNEALDDEMCILIGDTAGTNVPALCQYQTTPL